MNNFWKWDKIRQDQASLHFNSANAAIEESNNAGYWTRNILVALATFALGLVNNIEFFGSLCLKLLFFIPLGISVLSGLSSALIDREHFRRKAEIYGKAGAIFNKNMVYTQEEINQLLEEKTRHFQKYNIPDSGSLELNKIASSLFYIQLFTFSFSFLLGLILIILA